MNAIASTEKPYLSLCMIVKDAEETLPRLLESVRGRFDEFVFIDTGSTDKTRELLAEHFNFALGWSNAERGAIEFQWADKARVVFAHFDWIEDFAAARNFAFSLSTARWRMYLDADDELVFKVPGANLKKTVEAMEKKNPALNAFSMLYDYVPGQHDHVTVRIVRWEDGFRWEDPIHEMLMLPGKPRILGKFADVFVKHHKKDEDHVKAFERNRKIVQRYLDECTEDTPPARRARMHYHRATDLRQLGRVKEALDDYRTAMQLGAGTTYYLLASVELVQMLVEHNSLDTANDVAGQIIAQMPLQPDGYFACAWVNTLLERYPHAAALFDQAAHCPPEAHAASENVTTLTWYARGVLPAAAALAYAELGRIDEARAQVARVNASVRGFQQVWPLAHRAEMRIAQVDGLAKLKAMVDYYIWDTEADKALDLLDNPPAALATLPEVAALRRSIEAKMKHLDSWESYKAHYASIPPSVYHTDSHHTQKVLNTSRTQALLAWAEEKPKEGPPLRVRAIGFQDGIIEGALLDANPRIHLSVCDVAPQANQGLAKLQARYPGRVSSHDIVDHHYHWCSADEFHSFDLVTLFEVIEHVPDDEDALRAIRNMLKFDGQALISTPIASQWVEPYLTSPKGPPWYGHVRAHNHVSLPRLVERCGLTGTIIEGPDETFVMSLRTNASIAHRSGGHVAIVVPATPKPFDPFSPEEGFTGGSEECVVYLARELAKTYVVTVYAPVPEWGSRGDGVVRYHEGVYWRPVSEFDPLSDNGGKRYGTVIFWRAPHLGLESWMRDAPYRKLLWLHDAAYNVPPHAYDAFDGVLTLSKHHAKCIEKYDGFPAFKARQVANGIVEEMFPLWDNDERDLKRVVYCSSPDRGLLELLTIWPLVHEAVPEANLHIFYDWTQFRLRKPDEAAKLDALVEKTKDMNVSVWGGVSQPELHAWLRTASVWAYPHTGDIETFCITAVKAQASGAFPVTTTAGALPEVVQNGVFTTEEQIVNGDLGPFVNEVIDVLKNPPPEDVRRLLRERALQNYAWSKVAQMFSDIILEYRR